MLRRRCQRPLLMLLLCLQGRIADTAVGGVSLSWSKVSLSFDGRKILDGVTGEATRGRLLGIMGPSGAGKTSVLQVLAGTIPNSKGLQLRGEMGGDYFASGEREAAAFVGQDDRFHSQLSVSETLAFAAQLRLPRIGLLQRQRVVDELLRQLQLSHVSGTKVGDERCRGISGGERRRLALGCELVGKPALIFADEPTSGLDAFQAERMMEALRDLSEQGHTVIVSIHQPSSKIWRMLDDVMLVSEGKCCYIGPRDECLKFFSKLSYRCPPETNPAEFLLDLVSVDYSTVARERVSAVRVAALSAKWGEHWRIRHHIPSQKSCLPSVGRFSKRSGAGVKNRDSCLSPTDGDERKFFPLVRQRKLLMPAAFRVLLRRAQQQTVRDVFVNGVRLVATLALAGTFGAVWGNQSSVIERTGTIVMASVNSAMIAMVKSLTLFVEERPVVNRERRYYGAFPYLLSKILAEGPLDAAFAGLFGSMVHDNCHMLGDKQTFVTAICLQALASSALGQLIGACVPSPAAALASGPPLMVVLTIVGAVGPTGRPDLPIFMEPLRSVSAIRWGCEAMCVSELTAQEFQSTSPVGRAANEVKKAAFLKKLGLGGCSVQDALTGQLKLLAGCYAVTLAALIASRPSTLPMLPPEDEPPARR